MSIELPPVEIQSPILSPVEAGHVITDALDIVNKEENAIEVVYIGQPIGALEQTDSNLMIAPKEPLDLAIKYGDGTLEPFDFINVVPWVGYDAQTGRITTGFKDPQELAQEILTKLEQHLNAKENPDILISSSGSKYNIQNLQENTLTIDDEGFLRVNDKRLWIPRKDEPLLASSLRSATVIHVEEKGGKILFIDKKDPAPLFYIELNQTFHSSGETFLLFMREPGKI